MLKYGTIAGGNKITAQAAYQILENGGNAFDASVGAVFTSMVAEYNLTGPGGGGALLACPINKTPVLFDFFVDTPEPQPNKQLDFFNVLIDFGPSQQAFHIGKGSVAIPGNVAGLLKVHERLGKIPLKAVLEPAIVAAKDGVIIDEAQGYLFQILEPILSHSKAGEKQFKPKGKLIKKGALFQNVAFADLLENLILEGADFFYKGEGAKIILSAIGEQGLLTKSALENYRVIERFPLMSTFQGKTIFTNPAPATGGTLITFVLQLLEKTKQKNKWDLQTLVQAMQLASNVRHEICTNPNNETQISEILDDKIFNRYLQYFESNSQVSLNNLDPFSRGETTQVSIIDKEGNAASVTTTNGEGCGYFISELGLMLNNMLGEEDLNPMGFHQWPRQRRLPTMMSPTVIMGEKGVEMVLGSGGSNRIRSAIAQVILNVISKGMTLDEAVKAPRIHLEGNTLHYEPHIDIENNLNGYDIHAWDKQNLFFGGVNAVTKTEAVGDARRGGEGIVC